MKKAGITVWLQVFINYGKSKDTRSLFGRIKTDLVTVLFLFDGYSSPLFTFGSQSKFLYPLFVKCSGLPLGCLAPMKLESKYFSLILYWLDTRISVTSLHVQNINIIFMLISCCNHSCIDASAIPGGGPSSPGPQVIAWFAYRVATDPDMYMLVSTPLSNLFEPWNGINIITHFVAVLDFCAVFFSEIHQGNCPLPVVLGDIIAPTAAWLEVGKTGGKGPVVKKVLPPTPPRSQLHSTTCHPVQPSHAIQASPWANKDPFQASPHCDRAEQKQSVPLGCSLWSDPAFSLAAALPVCPTPGILLFEF